MQVFLFISCRSSIRRALIIAHCFCCDKLLVAAIVDWYDVEQSDDAWQNKSKQMRKDTLLLKQQLADALGEDGKVYWNKLSEFLNCKCSKEALDSIALSLFTDPLQSKLFICNFICNLQSKFTTTCCSQFSIIYRLIFQALWVLIQNLKSKTTRSARDKYDYAYFINLKAIMMGQHLKKKFNRDCVLSMTAAERNRFNADGLLNNTNNQITVILDCFSITNCLSLICPHLPIKLNQTNYQKFPRESDQKLYLKHVQRKGIFHLLIP